jgi:hypothetical protein
MLIWGAPSISYPNLIFAILFVNVIIFICYCHSHIFEACIFLKDTFDMDIHLFYCRKSGTVKKASISKKTFWALATKCSLKEDVLRTCYEMFAQRRGLERLLRNFRLKKRFWALAAKCGTKAAKHRKVKEGCKSDRRLFTLPRCDNVALNTCCIKLCFTTVTDHQIAPFSA